MDNEKKSSSKADLDLIKQMVTESQGLTFFSSKHFLLWGLIIPIATLCTLIADIKESYSTISVIWIVCCAIGTLLSIVLGVMEKPTHKTKISSSYKVLWIGMGINAIAVVVFMLVGKIPLNITLGFIALLLASSLLVSGFMHKNSIIKIVSILWYVTGLILFLFDTYNAGYIMGIASLFLNFIPGIILRIKYGRS